MLVSYKSSAAIYESDFKDIKSCQGQASTTVCTNQEPEAIYPSSSSTLKGLFASCPPGSKEPRQQSAPQAYKILRLGMHRVPGKAAWVQSKPKRRCHRSGYLPASLIRSNIARRAAPDSGCQPDHNKSRTGNRSGTSIPLTRRHEPLLSSTPLNLLSTSTVYVSKERYVLFGKK
jgi:hypothetical protein